MLSYGELMCVATGKACNGIKHDVSGCLLIKKITNEAQNSFALSVTSGCTTSSFSDNFLSRD